MPSRGLLVTLTLALLATGLGVLTPNASAAAPAPARGWTSAVQSSARISVHGVAFDPRHQNARVLVSIYVDGTLARRIRAGRPSPAADRHYGIRGRHAYATTFTWHARAATVAARSAGDRRGTSAVRFARDRVAHVAPRRSAGDRIVAIAKRYVGKARYREGGETPRQGFDCSGYTKYAYAKAGVATLPHNAEAQRTTRGMRHISAAKARPGDLIFYLSGGSVFHVAIYAGHHMQYAAATPKDGIRYQQVWSSDVVYGTDWH